MSSLLFILIAVFIAYRLFSRNGGMGCCGGSQDHHSADGRRGDSAQRFERSAAPQEEIIDLKQEDYQVLSDEELYADKSLHQEASEITGPIREKEGVR